MFAFFDSEGVLKFDIFVAAIGDDQDHIGE